MDGTGAEKRNVGKNELRRSQMTKAPPLIGLGRKERIENRNAAGRGLRDEPRGEREGGGKPTQNVQHA